MSRELPTIADIAARLAVDPPVASYGVSLIADLWARGEHEAAATIETLSRQLYETEKALLVARDALEWIVDYSDGLESPSAARNALDEVPQP